MPTRPTAMMAVVDSAKLRRLMIERNLSMSALPAATAAVTGRRVDHKTIARALREQPVQLQSVARIRAALKAIPPDDSPDVLLPEGQSVLRAHTLASELAS